MRRWIARVNLPIVTFAVAAIASCAYLLYLGRHATFFNDEWVFVFERSHLDLGDWFRPHNGHLSAVLVLVWRGLFEVVGLHTYLPYLAVLLAVHATAAAGVGWLMRRLAGPVLALAGSLVFLLLGTAYENLFWSFQMSFVGSVAAGTWALVALTADRPRPGLALGLLLVSIASSGIGLAFLAAAVVVVALEPRSRARVLAVLIPLAAYIAWYLVYARGNTDTGGYTVENLLNMPGWIHAGASRAVGGLTGLGDEIGGLLFLAVVAAVVVRLLTEPSSSIAVARSRATTIAAWAVAGLVAQFLLIGLSRGHLQAGNDLVLAPRYMYAPAAFFLIALAALIGRPPVETDARRAWPRRSLVIAPFALLALIANVQTLHISGVPYFEHQAMLLRTSIEIADRYPTAPAILEGRLPVNVPPDAMREMFEERGTPATDVLSPNPALEPDANTYDQVLFSIVAPSFVAETVSTQPGEKAPAEILGTQVLAAGQAGDCTELSGNGAVDSQVWFVAPSGSRHTITSGDAGEIQFFLSLHGEPQEANSIRVSVAAGDVLEVRVPDMGALLDWTLRLKFPNGLDMATLCRVAEPGA